MSKKAIPVYELYIDDDNDLDGLTAMGFVDNPAIQANFLYFNKDINKYVMSSINEEQRIVVGPAMIPNKKIIRQNVFGELYYAEFSEKTVEELAHNFLKESKQHITTEQHAKPLKGIYMIESWVTKNDQDKIYTEYGYSPEVVHIGSWCIMYKIDNEDTIAKIKSGEINGFSIEAYLSDKLKVTSELEELFNRIDKYENKNELIELIKNPK